MDVFDELVRLRNLGQKCALATIVEVNGSIPAYQTAKLLVREGGITVNGAPVTQPGRKLHAGDRFGITGGREWTITA